MKKLFKKLKNYAFFLVFRVRPFTRKKVKEIALFVKKGNKVLEIGSGPPDREGNYYFSSYKYFQDKKVEFLMSDINPKYGHRVVDITNFKEREKYNHILCFHVLDDIYDWQKAFLNLYRALKNNGYLHIILPGFNGLDFKVDYFRFTEKLLREFCRRNNINIERLEIHGFKTYPFAYYLRVKKT